MTTKNIELPAIGQPFPGQGGIYAGFMPARNGAEGYHLILGDELPGRFEWGPYDDLAQATSLVDGLANTKALLAADGTYPAAQGAAAHTAEGRADFYLPAAAELYEIWLNLNGKLAGWVWSSSQRSADSAFYVGFDDGNQHDTGKLYELRVRPVRRFIQ
ncbi:DUF1566 domain-containing protein [Phytopseudomonas punonensis]|uniref:DUF1566 domain-containing protein n=1 Tax=Phytopseudomonas punonensis TaxID=1220495 RepID=A0A1M7LK54_9GAMM|nr:DUF1566 domain-containing protein [Pseudomonas punonensis]SHM78420.1 hypothetical protein SAMN05216288_4287 [Pseudomonas punonensis]